MNFFSEDGLDDEVLLQADNRAVNNASHSSPVWGPPTSGAEPAPSPTSSLPIPWLPPPLPPGERKGETVHSQPAQPGAGSLTNFNPTKQSHAYQVIDEDWTRPDYNLRRSKGLSNLFL